MSTLCPESFGIITRKVVPRTATERMQDWLRNLAPIRAAAVSGDESTLDFAPNVVPMRRPLSRMQVVRAALEDHCRMLGLSDAVAEDAIARCRNWLAHDIEAIDAGYGAAHTRRMLAQLQARTP